MWNIPPPRQVREANKYLLADAALALAIAFIINLAVVGCFAELFFNKGTVCNYASVQLSSSRLIRLRWLCPPHASDFLCVSLLRAPATYVYIDMIKFRNDFMDVYICACRLCVSKHGVRLSGARFGQRTPRDIRQLHCEFGWGTTPGVQGQRCYHR